MPKIYVKPKQSVNSAHAMNIHKFVISPPGEHYQAWPDLVRTRAGKLLCVFSACTHHGDRSFTQIMLCESEDDGASWSSARPVTEPCGIPIGYYYNNASVSQLPDGRLALVFDRIEGNDENLSPTRILLAFSQDDGASWSSAIPTPAQGIVPDKLQELSSGRWILPCHFCNPTTRRLEQRLWFSEDRGASWQGPIVVAAAPGLNLCEGSFLEVEPGTLVCFLRENSWMGLPCYRAISRDGGLTWEGPYPFPVPCCHRPKAGMLADGNIAITYRLFQGGANCAQNTFLALTDVKSILEPDYKQCRSRLMPLDHDEAEGPDTGYTGWAQLPDGNLIIANYIVDQAEKAWICGYNFDLNGFTKFHSIWHDHA